MPVAVGYARYSTRHQNEKSIDDQTRELHELCGNHGLFLREVFSDAQISGQTNRRPGFLQLIKAVESGGVDVVVAESSDRLTRDQEHSARLSKACKFRNVKIITILDGWTNELVLGLRALGSTMSIDATRIQAHRGNRSKVLAGLNAGGRSYGYRVKIGADGRAIAGEREIVPHEAEVVLRIMREYADGRPPAQIAANLNAEGIPAPRASHWKQNTINGNAARGTGIIHNPLYRGVIHWNRLQWRNHPETGRRIPFARPEEQHDVVEAPHLRIVDDELWERVERRKAIIAGKRSNRTSKCGTQMDTAHAARRARYLLSGLLT